jgi:apolipoprotein N-acyltransferase
MDPTPRFGAPVAAAVAVAGGLIGVGAFPRFGIWPLAFVSVAALSLAVDGRRARTGAWIGLLYGVAFFVPVISWTGVYVGPVPWLILAVAEAGYLAGLGAVLAVVQRYRFAPFWVGASWVLQEAARDRTPFGGFPWARLAFSQAASPVRWFAALGGAPLVTFVVAFGGAGIAVGCRQFTVRQFPVRQFSLRSLTVAVVPIAAVIGLGAILAWPLAPPSDRHSRTTTVALIQGNVPDIGLDFEDRPRQVLDNHVSETLKLAAQVKAGTVARPSLVVWPEDSSDVDPFADPSAYSEIDQTVKAIGAPILVGAILDGPGPTHRRNVGILWSPTTGPGSEYVKRHPVPFGEYIPLRSIASLVSSDVNLVTQDMVAGSGNGLVTGGPFPIGDVICFEVAYDDLVQSSVNAGAQLLVVQTNNATFGHTAETYQQLAMSQLRAVETGRTVLQVATTGMSAVIGPDGTIRQKSGNLYTADEIVASVPLHSSITLAVRLGPGPEYALSGLAFAAVAWSIWIGFQARRLRRRATSAAAGAARDHEPAQSETTAPSAPTGPPARQDDKETATT